MDIKDIKKLSLLSDTHMHLSSKAYDAICGNYSSDQIYNQEIFVQDKNASSSIKNALIQLNSKQPDLIIHAGDIGNQEIIDVLESVCPIVAVNGNCDFHTFNTLQGQTQDFEIFEFEGCGIAVAHRPHDLTSFLEGSFLRPAKTNKDSPEVNLRIHGHTHEAKIVPTDAGYILICPGSASMGRYGTPDSICNVYIYDRMPIAAQLINIE